MLQLSGIIPLGWMVPYWLLYMFEYRFKDALSSSYLDILVVHRLDFIISEIMTSLIKTNAIKTKSNHPNFEHNTIFLNKRLLTVIAHK
jgi:hypothetical protein